MPRRILVRTADGSIPILTEARADDEAQLQELMKDNPDLLPIEDIGLTGPVMTIGRETTLPSGSVDIVALTQAGDLLVIEFKVGPENQDFRRALAQLLDYGSDMWGMSYEEFETTVPVRYFASPYCKDQQTHGKGTLDEAIQSAWSDISVEQADQLRNNLTEQLTSGAFTYILVAQRFTETSKKTIDYLNAISQSARFRAVEIVCFEGNALSAFESRAIPSSRSLVRGSPRPILTGETQFLGEVDSLDYQKSLHEFFELCRGLGLTFAWGSAGVSIRVHIADTTKPVSIAWPFPPGRAGWMGLTDLSLGFDTSSAAPIAPIQGALDWYFQAVGALPGAKAVKPKFLKAWTFSPQAFQANQQSLTEILVELVHRLSEQA